VTSGGISRATRGYRTLICRAVFAQTRDRNEKLVVGRALSRFGDTANLLGVVQTCRRQGRSVISFFACALRAHVGHIGAFPLSFSVT